MVFQADRIEEQLIDRGIDRIQKGYGAARAGHACSHNTGGLDAPASTRSMRASCTELTPGPAPRCWLSSEIATCNLHHSLPSFDVDYCANVDGEIYSLLVAKTRIGYGQARLQMSSLRMTDVMLCVSACNNYILRVEVPGRISEGLRQNGIKVICQMRQGERATILATARGE